MGRKTYESIVARLGKPLPNRENVVITSDPAFEAPGCKVVHSVEEALTARDDVFVIGGARVFTEALPKTDRVYLTQVAVDIEGDTFFPELNMSEWKVVSREPHASDDKNQYPYEFLILDRR